MKQAILITAYKHFDHLYDIVTFFDHRFEVYIHIDKKSNISKKMHNQLMDIPIVKFISRKYNIKWGGRNHLKGILHLTEVALKNSDLQIFHFITGQDYPIKSPDYFFNYFKNHSKTNYLSSYKLPYAKWEDGGLSRLEYYHFYDILNAKKHRRYIFKLVDLQKKYNIKRKFSKRIPQLYGGETYWTLTRAALSYVLDYTHKRPFLFKRLRHTFCAEEIYFQTVLMNSAFALSVVNDSLRYIDWNTRNGNFPANLDLSDLDPITNSHCLFARKFEFPISEQLKNKLIIVLNNNNE